VTELVRDDDTIFLFNSYNDPLPDSDFPGFEDLGACVTHPERVLDAKHYSDLLLEATKKKILEELNITQKRCNFEKVSVFTSEACEPIVEAIKKNNIDMTLLGSRGRGTIKSILLGSVSTYVVQHSPTSVLVVR